MTARLRTKDAMPDSETSRTLGTCGGRSCPPERTGAGEMGWAMHTAETQTRERTEVYCRSRAV